MAIANIVTVADFVGRYAYSTNTYSDEKFDSFITQEQYQLLIDILGAGLYNTYDAAPTDVNWVALRDGATYTGLDGYVYNWQGLDDLMVPFIFAKYVESDHLKAEQSGLIKAIFENAEVATDYERTDFIYKRWNEFIDKYNQCFQYLSTQNSNDNTKYTDFWIHFRKKFKKGIITKGNIT